MDRENVIEYLSDGILMARATETKLVHIDADTTEEILALLKEQEAKPPAIMQDIEGIWSTCSMCGHKLRPILAMKMDTYFPKFCTECGQAVKWNE